MSLTQLFKHWTYQIFAPGALLRTRYNAFKELLEHDEACLELIAELEEIHYGHDPVDWARVEWLCGHLADRARLLMARLADLNPGRHMGLSEYLEKRIFYMRMGVSLPAPDVSPPHVIPLREAAGEADMAGGKAANLALAAARARVTAPPGFVATAAAFHYFIEHNELREIITDKLRNAVLSKPEELALQCGAIRDLILAAEVPPSLAHDLDEAATALGHDVFFAVRSSAVAEDGESSFAGQYATELHVTPASLGRAYKRVLASKYSPKAVTYRILCGLSDLETPMAVLVMPMVASRVSGVIYTHDPKLSEAGDPSLGVYAVAGLGSALVDGQATPQVYSLPRPDAPAPGGQAMRPERVDTRGPALLDHNQVLALAGLGMELEGLFGAPQDVEWALDETGRLILLQTRPQRREAALPPPIGLPGAAETHGAAILVDACERAAAGIGCGPLYHVDAVMDVARIPPGSVIVVQNLAPALARTVRTVQGVIARTGSRASHFASVAREFGVPVLVTHRDMAHALPQGHVVTVDGWNGRVLQGRVEALMARAGESPKTPLARRLDAVMPGISRLTLTDPDAENFVPQRWRSIHDAVRYAHEMAVSEMFSLVDKGGRAMHRSRKLKTHLPLVMYVLDLGGGLLEAAATRKEVTPNDISCLPMWSLWWGLSASGVVWHDGLTHMDWEAFDKVSAGIVSKDARMLASYAVLGPDYMHLMLRFGYHFAVVDSLCGGDAPNNYINFRFKGGGGTSEGRLLRVGFISRILTRYGFTVRVTGDMLDAGQDHVDATRTRQSLAILGYLLARTRLLDMQLAEAPQVDALERDFLRGVEELMGARAVRAGEA
ncbi:MAG: PEP/pyruvate-binding domain-containing protein [Desulfovibrionaceae bacterium]